MANNIYKRKKVKNSDIMELFLYYALTEEEEDLSTKEKYVFYDTASYYYIEGQRQAGRKKPFPLSETAFLSLMDMPNSAGYTWKEYKGSSVLRNMYELYRLAVQSIQQGIKPDAFSTLFKNMLQKQQNRKIKIKDEKISGDADLTMIGINNQALAEGMTSVDNNAKVKFIAVMDDRTTPMCESLDGQVFNVHDWNEFIRYSDINKSEKKYRCYGMILGLNLPPIDDHFHWCRSTIEYVNSYNLDKKYNLFSSKFEKEIERQYNINKVRAKGLDKKVLTRILDNMKDVYKDFPQLKNKIKEIQVIEHPNGGMNIEPDLKDNKYVMQINKKFFSNEKVIQGQYERDVKTGFHPKGTTYKDMGTHELGHCAIYEILKKKYSNENDIIEDWNRNVTAYEIVKKAFVNIGVTDKLTQDILRNNISNYAITNYGETIGEAFADYYANRSNANSLSKEIIKIMKGMI